MDKFLKLRKVSMNDLRVLLEWKNDKITRENSLNTNLVSANEHKDYLEKIIASQDINQFILEFNETPIGTIREIYNSNTFNISYTVSPKYRGKKIGQIMMSLYLLERKGVFECEVKPKNISSIKMIEKLGFINIKKVKNNLHFQLTQS